MKKLTAIIMSFFILLSIMPISFAVENIGNTSDIEYAIDEIISQMNKNILKEKMLLKEYRSEESAYNIANATNQTSTELSDQLISIENSNAALEQELFALGVKKAAPNDTQFFSQFNQSNATRSTPPTLPTLANIYTLYYYDGNYTYNGVTYPYRYIKVVDNKGYDGLYVDDITFSLVGSVASQAVFQNVMSYNFGYVTSALIGRIPYVGSGLNWTIGMLTNIFSVPNCTFSTNGSMYMTIVNSVTSMTYYYVSDPNHNGAYELAGSHASSVEIVVGHYFAGNVNGSPVQDNTTDNLSGTSGQSWYHYIEWFADRGTHKVDEFGSLRIRGYNNSMKTFTPAFAALPGHLV